MNVENLESTGKQGRGPAKRRTWLALIGASIPLLCAIQLRIVNPSYFGHFFAIETRAIGLPLIVIVIILSVVAFLFLLGSLAIYRTGREGLGSALFIAVILLLVLPATLIILLGPAAFLMFQSALGELMTQ